MTIINVNSISGINSITAQGASGIEFYDSSGNSVQTVTGDGLTVGTGATISGSTNTITASTNGEERLSIDSSGLTTLSGTGDVTLYLKADTDNVDEDHNPKISMSQDGGTSSYFDIGITGSAGGEFTDALANTAYIKSVSNATTNGIQFATNGAARMYLNNSGNLGIGTDNSVFPKVLNVQGSSGSILMLSSQNTKTGAEGVNASIETRCDDGNGGTVTTEIRGCKENGTSGNNASYISFHTRTNGASMAEAARFNSSGNLVFPDGQGIDFSAVAGSGMVSGGGVLDDYEEGTWTADMSFNGSSSGVITTNDEAFYIKVGRMVTCWGRITLSNNGSGVGGARLTGLPFPVADVVDTTGLDGGGFFCYQNNVTGTVYGSICILPEDGETTATLYGSTDTSGNMVGMTNSNISDSFDSRFVFSYVATT